MLHQLQRLQNTFFWLLLIVMRYNGLLYAVWKISYTKITYNEFSSMSSRAATQVFQGVEEQGTSQLKDGEKLDEASLF